MNTEKKFAAIYNEKKQYIYFHILKSVRNVNVAEELTNDVFLKVSNNLEVFDVEVSTLNTWIMNIMKNTVIDYYRKVKNKDFTVSIDDEGTNAYNQVESKSSETLIENKELDKKIKSAIDRLKGKQKEVAVLFFVDEKKYSEIATILDMPMGSVKATLLRARQQLQEQLQSVYA